MVVVADSGTPDVAVGEGGAVVGGEDVATGDRVVPGASVASDSALVFGAAVVGGDAFVNGDAAFTGAFVVAVTTDPTVVDAVIEASVGDVFGGACAPADDVDL